MQLESLTSLVALVLSISVAAERLVTIAKSAFPKWFAADPAPVSGIDDLQADRGRRIRVLLIAIGSSWAAAATFADGGFNPIGRIMFANKTMWLPVWLVGLLASGGSAIWSNIINYTSALKDLRGQQTQLAAGLSSRVTAGDPIVAPSLALSAPVATPAAMPAATAMPGAVDTALADALRAALGSTSR